VKHHVRKQGLPASYQTREDRLFYGLSAEQRRVAIWYEAEGFGDLAFIARVLQSPEKQEQKLARDWYAIWLINNQGILWAWGYNQEQRKELYKELERLRVSGQYAQEFHRYDLCCGD
jgi:hypothetical protein